MDAMIFDLDGVVTQTAKVHARAWKRLFDDLAAAGIRDRFDVTVDGVDADELGFPGKPDPALFLEAARRLGVEPGRSAIVEDALAGVEAGCRGAFVLVIGVDRGQQRDALASAGADVVVADLAEVTV